MMVDEKMKKKYFFRLFNMSFNFICFLCLHRCVFMCPSRTESKKEKEIERVFVCRKKLCISQERERGREGEGEDGRDLNWAYGWSDEAEINRSYCDCRSLPLLALENSLW